MKSSGVAFLVAARFADPIVSLPPYQFARDTSVIAGDVDAEVFGDNKGGLFRTISKDSSGHYSLHAHVGTGQLTLR